LAVAIAAVIAGIVFLATKTTFFQDAWKSMIDFVVKAWTGFGKLFESIGNGIGSFFGTLGSSLSKSWTETIEGLTGAAKGFGEAFMTVFRGVGNFFRNIVNGYIGLWEGFINGILGGVNGIIRAVNSIKITLPSWIPGLGGQSFGVNLPTVSNLNIPRLADGGIVMPTPGGVLANIAEGGKPEAVIPLDRLGKMGGTTINVTVNAGMGADGNRIGQMIVDEIIKFERTSGKVFARA
jgi:phage-related protein